MNVLVDQQLPPALAQWLNDHGVSARHVRDVGLRDADDREIWAFAVREQLVVVTKDEDFAARCSISSDGPAIVWLRLGNSTNAVLFEWLGARWEATQTALADGASVVEVR